MNTTQEESIHKRSFPLLLAIPMSYPLMAMIEHVFIADIFEPLAFALACLLLLSIAMPMSAGLVLSTMMFGALFLFALFGTAISSGESEVSQHIRAASLVSVAWTAASIGILYTKKARRWYGII